MKILHLSMFDTAGVPWLQCRALNRVPGVTARWHRMKRGLFGEYQPDFPGREHEAVDFAMRADVLHWHGTHALANGRALAALGRPAVVEIHGAPERGRGTRPATPCTLIVSTPDMLAEYPDAEWVPNAVFPDEHPWLPDPDRPAEPVVICRGASPHPALKDVGPFDRAGAWVEAAVQHATYLPLQRMPWREYNEVKRRCHVLLDHLQGYFGVVTIEALAQGVVPVVSLRPDVRAAVERRFDGLPPWLDASGPERLHQELAALVRDPATLAEQGRACRAFAVERWDPADVTRQLLGVYERAALSR